MMLSRRKLALAAASLVAPVGRAARAQGSQATREGGPSPLRVASNPTVIEAGVLLRAVELWTAGRATTVDGGIANLWASTPEASATGVADLAGNSETQMLYLSARNPGSRILLTLAEGRYRVVGRRSAGISGPDSLRGKRIATQVDASAGYFLRSVLDHAALAASDVTVVNLPPPRMTEALLAGSIDAMAIWEPEPQRAMELLGGDAVEFRPPGVYRELYSLYASDDALSNPNSRKQVVSFVRSMIAACHEAATDPDRTQALIAERTQYDVALVRACWSHISFPCALPDDLLDTLVAEERWCADQAKRAPRNREQLMQLIDPSILGEANSRL